jgi:metacaspase-1|uniref:Peptidase C14 caspase domain-containing protein n=1 Tax=viral metagenome TaxID=1070528 RepID=A0A6C0INB2_9ZZZZ
MVKRAVLIGIDYVNNRDLRLYGCINDAIVMQGLLIDAYGYEKKNTTVLRDDGISGALSPTRKNIIQSIYNTVQSATSDDEVWIHYSGHGISDTDRNNDETDGKDELMVPVDYRESGCILDDTLRDLLRRTQCTIFITQDCCHSGTIWDLPYVYKRDSYNRATFIREANDLTNKRVYMLSGSRDNQLASDSYSDELSRGIGAFTSSFIDCLRECRHEVKIVELVELVNKKLQENNFEQRSVFSSSDSNPQFVSILKSGIVNNNYLAKSTFQPFGFTMTPK